MNQSSEEKSGLDMKLAVSNIQKKIDLKPVSG